MKYLNPFRYFRRLKFILVKIIFWIGIPITVKTKVDSFTVKFITTSFVEYALRAKLSYTREKVTMEWIRNYIKPNDVVYDVGANVGAYSLLIGKMLAKGDGQVFSFEPESSNFYSLNRNVSVNDLDGKVLPYSIALGDRSRATTFYLSSTIPGSAMHGMDKPESDGVSFKSKYQQGAYIVSMDIFCSDPAVKFPNHIKIDVDGSEKDIVRSMHNVMKDSRLKSIMIEIDEEVSLGEIENMITQAGFQEKDREQWHEKNVYNILYAR